MGRSAQLTVLHGALAAARAGRPRVVVVDGEPGIGKTALLRHFLAEARDVSTLWASGYEDESYLEFGVIDQLGGTGAGSVRVGGGTDSIAVGSELLAGLGALQDDGPVVVVVDDLHWSDQSSSRALLFCLRRLRTDAVLVLLATRPQALDRLGDGWRRLSGDRLLARWLHIGGLSVTEVGDLAEAQGRTLPLGADERLQRHTGGNPLHLSALLAELPAGALDAHDGILPAPRSYASTVVARLAGASPAGRELVCAAAVLGLRAPLRAVAAVAGVADPLPAAEQAAAAGLVAMGGTGPAPELLFVHPLVRAAVYDDLSPVRRRQLHLAAAAALGPPVAYRHRVLAVAGQTDGQLADELVALAEEEAVRGSLREAAEHLLGASQVDPDSARSDDSLFRAVELLLLAGDVDAAQAQAAAVDARPDSVHRRYTTALLDSPSGDFPRTIAELRWVAESAPPGTDPLLVARCSAALAYLSAMSGQHDVAVPAALRARGLAGNVLTVDTLARQALAWSHGKSGRVEQALEEVSGASPDSVRPSAFDAELLLVRGSVRTWAGQIDAALTDLTAVVRWVQLGFPVTDVVSLYAALAEAEFRRGDWDSTAVHVEVAVSLGTDLDHRWYLPYAHAVATALHAARGNDGFALAHARAADLAARGAGSEAMAYAALALAHRAWGIRDWAGVVAALRPWDRGDSGLPIGHPNLAGWRTRLAEAYAELGRPSDARRLLEDLAAPPWGGTSDDDRQRLTALVLSRAGDVDAAAAMLADATARIPASSRSLSAGLLVLDYGRLLVGQRRRRQVPPVVLVARGILAGLGAQRLVADCDTLLSACGVAPIPEGSPAAAAGLTAREQLVATMVDAGMTNREVAAELYLSVKAIEYHLGNIYSKVGVHSRRELRALLHDPATAPLPAGIATGFRDGP